jgi:hypothetical protein
MGASRKKRKRYRAREQSAPEATATNEGKTLPTAGNARGLWGQSAVLTRGDLALIRSAVNTDWPVRESMRRRLVAAIFEGFDELDQNPHSPSADRWSIAAARTVIAMDAANIRAERHAMAAGGSKSPEP